MDTVLKMKIMRMKSTMKGVSVTKEKGQNKPKVNRIDKQNVYLVACLDMGELFV